MRDAPPPLAFPPGRAVTLFWLTGEKRRLPYMPPAPSTFTPQIQLPKPPNLLLSRHTCKRGRRGEGRDVLDALLQGLLV